MMIDSNYHTHTYRCTHAQGTEEDYVIEAINNNYKELGISDHGPFNNNKYDFRMDFSEFEDYLNTINNLKSKYKDKINILSSVEIEFFEDSLDFYNDLLSKYKLDYLTLGQHMIKINNTLYYDCDFHYNEYYMLYAKTLKKAMDTKLFKLIAHPDFYLKSLTPWNETAIEAANIIIDSAVKNDCILEINANGVRKGLQTTTDGKQKYVYPNENFFKLALEKKAKIIINSDCHNPKELLDDAVKSTYDLAKKWGISPLTRL